MIENDLKIITTEKPSFNRKNIGSSFIDLTFLNNNAFDIFIKIVQIDQNGYLDHSSQLLFFQKEKS